MATDAANVDMDLYNNAVDIAVPWSKLRETITDLDKPLSECFEQCAGRLGSVKAALMNSIDSYDQATQSVREWCSYASSTLSRYVNLMNNPNPALKNTQKDLLTTVLDHEFKQMLKAHGLVSDSLSALQLASEEFTHLKSDYAENGEFFKKRFDQLVKEKSSFWKRRKTVENEALNELREKLKPTLASIENYSGLVREAKENLEKSMPTLKIKIVTTEKLNIVAKASSADDTSENHQAIAESAKALIAKCTEFLKRHP